MVDVDFEALVDRTERDALRRIPTSWSLDVDTVARIRGAARTLMDESIPFQALLRDLGATRRLPCGGAPREPPTASPGH